ncbi:MAG TPA: ABC transporter substrate-binding protein [Burkholderiaceae bacterium]|jgi:peptide/nickel transport system substrate-binding protein|nr:ABC transporter substrate-binding protein [Burkholderiaceae bacterium]
MRPVRLLLALALAVAATALPAQTLRFASAGDLQTLDPVSQNVSFTNAMNGQVYEFLVARDKQLQIVPQLATEWKQDGPLRWTFKLRRGVKFHDGRPLRAEDVVFSVQRAKEPTSQISNYANALGEVRKIDEETVEFNLSKFNPIFLQHLNTVYIMSRSWCEEHKATKPLDFANREESYTAFHANGTGPYMLVSREPDVKTVYRRNPNYWGRIEGNVREVVFTPIKSDATRLAALISGEIDFVLDPPVRDLDRLRTTQGVKLLEGLENRVIFIGMDQGRDELLYSSVKGRNPFKDVRVRRALYQAVDIETLRAKLMNGKAAPTGAVVPSPQGSFNDPRIEQRLPYDLEGARSLMAQAGYPEGFEVTLDCPNNRYINDERICITLAAMWARLNVRVRVNAMPMSSYFPKLEKLDTSMYMLGWGGSITDAETIFTPVYRNRADKGVGFYNYGNYRDDPMDALIAASSVESDPGKRNALIRQVFAIAAEQVHYIPLHRQYIPWAARSTVDAVHRADNWLEWQWVTMKSAP